VVSVCDDWTCSYFFLTTQIVKLNFRGFPQLVSGHWFLCFFARICNRHRCTSRFFCQHICRNVCCFNFCEFLLMNFMKWCWNLKLLFKFTDNQKKNIKLQLGLIYGSFLTSVIVAFLFVFNSLLWRWKFIP